LAEFSGPLAAASADKEVRALRGDIREAQDLGPLMASLMESESRASDDLRQILLPIKRFLLEHLAGIMEGISDLLHEYKPVLAGSAEATVRLAELAADFARGNPIQAGIDAAQLPKRIAEAIQAAKEGDDTAVFEFLERLEFEAGQWMVRRQQRPQEGRPRHRPRGVGPADNAFMPAFGGNLR
jgi:hypothetical protein